MSRGRRRARGAVALLGVLLLALLLGWRLRPPDDADPAGIGVRATGTAREPSEARGALQAATRGASLREMQQAARAAQAQFAPSQWREIEREGRALAQRHFSATTPRDFQEGVFGDLDAQHCERD